MKKILIFMTVLFYSNVGISQTKNDVIDYKNINIDLLNRLIIEKVGRIRDSLNLSKPIYDETLLNVTKFQNDYLSNYDVLTHGNSLKLKNKSLNSLIERINFFNPNKKCVACFEISTCFPYMPTRNDMTYEYVSFLMVNAYMSSLFHRAALIIDGDSETSFNVRINFKTSLSSNSKKLYNTGVIFVESNNKN
jgi:hypothetical protein